MKPSRPRVYEDHYQHEHPASLAIYCSDGRFTRGVEGLLAHLGYTRLDTLTMPGGPALIDPTSADRAEMLAVRHAVSFLIEGHALKELLLVAHMGCGYYARRYPELSPEAIHDQQVADLRAASAWATSTFPALVDVDTYYASAEGDRVVFTEIDPD